MPCVAVAHTSSLVTVQDFGNHIGCTVATLFNTWSRRHTRGVNRFGTCIRDAVVLGLNLSIVVDVGANCCCALFAGPGHW
jgi:hypothetical protein